MKKLWIITAMLIAFGLGLSTPAFTQGDHPRIRAARRHLEEARMELQNATHEFRGHRAKALDHVNRAIEECDKALEVR